MAKTTLYDHENKSMLLVDYGSGGPKNMVELFIQGKNLFHPATAYGYFERQTLIKFLKQLTTKLEKLDKND